MRNRFFSYLPEYGYETHATAEEARARCQTDLDDARGEGWSESPEDTAWGEIRESAVCTMNKSVEEIEAEGDEYNAGRMRAEGWDFLADYAMQPIEPEPAAEVPNA